MSDSKLIVAKDNRLIQASYTLSLAEQRVILMCIAKIDSRKPLPSNYEFTISVDELHRESGITKANAARDLRAAVDKLYQQTIFLDPEDKFSEMRWLFKKAAFKSEGTIVLSFSPPLLPFLSELKERFTTYRLKDVSKFKSSYSLRFYEILAQWKCKTELKVDLVWLRGILQLGDKYPRVIDLKRYVIDPAVNDINEFSNISVGYTQVKSGRVVTHLVFTYSFGISGEIDKPVKLTRQYIEKHAKPGETWEQARERLQGR
jgi:plasmid replication initiation protein